MDFVTATESRTVHPVTSLRGTVPVPPDKSIAHRAALLGALAKGTSVIENFSPAADPQSTLSCLKQLGIITERPTPQTLIIHGKGKQGMQPPRTALDCGNSGTTMRLLAGILAGQPFSSTLTGDASLSKRPMLRIARPLWQMGASLTLTDNHAPITLSPASLQGITYPLPIASAQVKSCILLAGLFAKGDTKVIERTPSRDHTERMLDLPIEEQSEQRIILLPEGWEVPPQHLTIPGDFSAAAFFLVAASILPDSELLIPQVGLNPSRTGLLTVLQAMGADITIENYQTTGKEPVGDLRVRSAPLRGIEIGGSLIPNIIDEIPVLAVAAAFAEGPTIIREAAELRVKETDRIRAMALNLSRLGVAVKERDDGLEIYGPSRPTGGVVESYGDHRIAMALAIAALGASGPVTIQGAEAVHISFPSFWQELAHLTAMEQAP